MQRQKEDKKRLLEGGYLPVARPIKLRIPTTINSILEHQFIGKDINEGIFTHLFGRGSEHYREKLKLVDLRNLLSFACTSTIFYRFILEIWVN
ncbi:MAG: hypothetical protein C5B43_00245 [Verrucomicrobia bacterium]|nr:MAG: hypothetical protein C5B43_00245 [Verrucomicrobiota bacterium]